MEVEKIGRRRNDIKHVADVKKEAVENSLLVTNSEFQPP
jgi:hypothetical protein